VPRTGPLCHGVLLVGRRGRRASAARRLPCRRSRLLEPVKKVATAPPTEMPTVPIPRGSGQIPLGRAGRGRLCIDLGPVPCLPRLGPRARAVALIAAAHVAQRFVRVALALRCVKRRLSDIVLQTMLNDAVTATASTVQTGPGGQRRHDSDSPHWLFGQVTSRTRHQPA
jgi:hypothetical protein